MTRSRVLVALRIAASPERTFEAFTTEIDRWWQPNALFRFTDREGTHLAFEPDPPERLVEIGPILDWTPPQRLAFGWRQAGMTDEQATEVVVRFDAVTTGTRVTVEHFGWDAVPQEHAARHGFPLDAFQLRVAEWWQELLRSLGATATA